MLPEKYWHSVHEPVLLIAATLTAIRVDYGRLAVIQSQKENTKLIYQTEKKLGKLFSSDYMSAQMHFLNYIL